MKTLYKSIILAIAAVSLSACDLDLFPKDSIVLDEDKPLIQTENDLETYRWAGYAYFRSLLGGGYDIADDLMCDGFNATKNYGNNYGGIHRADISFTSSDNYVESFWGNNYLAIKNYNLMIAEVDKCSDPALKEGVELIAAESYFFRAFSYLRLARRFGKAYNKATAATDLCVPLVLVYDQAARPARNTVKQVYDQIKADIDSSLTVLGTVKGTKGSELVTADVVKALLANWYLDTQDYKKAFDTADEIISSNTYPLVTTASDFAKKYSADSGEETLMMLPVSKTEVPNGYGIYLEYQKDANSPKGGFSYKSYYLPSATLVNSYKSGDMRLSTWFEYVSSVPFSCGSQYYFNSEFCVFVKYKGNVELSSSSIPDAHVAPVPFSIGELYLIAAEAGLTANKMKGLARLTALQKARQGSVATTLTAEAIHEEWFRETVGEGKRIECLKRWGAACPQRSAQPGAIDKDVLENNPVENYYERELPADAYQYTWPIPSYEIKVNPNLVQNIGY